MSLIGGKDADFSYEIFKQRLQQREIWLNGKIDDKIVGIVCPALSKLDTEGDLPITLYVNSFGGSLYEGSVLFDYIIGLKSPVNTVALGKAMSAGFTIFMAGEKRSVYSSTSLLAHTASHKHDRSKVPDIEDSVNHTKRLLNKQAEDFAKRTNKSNTWWKKVLEGRRDVYFPLSEVMDYGIATDLIA